MTTTSNCSKLTTSFDELKQIAFAIKEPIRIFWPETSQIEVFTPKVNGLDKSYGINNCVISFVSDGIFYVLPYAEQAIDILKNNGFLRVSMYIPFAHSDYPLAKKQQWENLKDFMANL